MAAAAASRTLSALMPLALFLAMLALPAVAVSAARVPAGHGDGAGAVDVAGGSDYPDYAAGSSRFDEYPFIQPDEDLTQCIRLLWEYLPPFFHELLDYKSRRIDPGLPDFYGAEDVTSCVIKMKRFIPPDYFEALSITGLQPKKQMRDLDGDVVVPKRTALLLDRLMTELQQAIGEGSATASATGSGAGSKVPSPHYSVDPMQDSRRKGKGKKKDNHRNWQCYFNPGLCTGV